MSLICTRRVLLGILGGGGAARFSKSWPYFCPKLSFSHTRFQTRPLKSIPVFRLACVAAGPRTRLNHLYSPSALYTEGLERLRRRQFQTWSLRNYVIITWIRTPNKRLFKIHFEFVYYHIIPDITLSFPVFIWNWNDKCVHALAKMGKIYIHFQSKTAQKPYPLGRHMPIWLI